jgi:predicted transcriptional regulator
MALGIRGGVKRVAISTQIVSGDLASDWIIQAMAAASLSVSELSRKSGVPRETIYSVIQHRQKNGCRLDIFLTLLESCGVTLRDFNSAVRLSL